MQSHPNELCRDLQLQIGKVDHLQRHLRPCKSERNQKGLTLGSHVKCFPYVLMCDRDLTTYDFVDEDCPPLSRLLKSDFFCLNHTNFGVEGTGCHGYPCSGNSRNSCYDSNFNCSEHKAMTQAHRCSDNSDYVCDKEAGSLDDFLISLSGFERHNFTRCAEEGHFVCSDGKKCIHRTLKCDGHEQCDDGSDEGEVECGICP